MITVTSLDVYLSFYTVSQPNDSYSSEKKFQLQWCLEFTANTRLHSHYNMQCRRNLSVFKQNGTNSWIGPQTVELEKVQHACTQRESTA